VLNEDGTFTGSLSSGNSTLEPYASMNLDLSIEYYLGSGLVSVAPFYKRIDDPIYDRSVIELNTIYNDRRYDRLSVMQPENAPRGHIGGVELNYQDTFSALPSPFDGLGTNLNYTITDSGVTVFGRDEELPFFKQSNHIGNVAALYEKYGIAAQVSLAFHSANLGTVGTSPDTDNYGDRYTPIDAKVSFPVMRALRGLVEVRNLNNESRRRFAGSRQRRVHHEIYSRDVYAGIDWRF